MIDTSVSRLPGSRSTGTTAHATLILLRHGESTANASDTFGGWREYALTPRGRRQAAAAAATLVRAHAVPTAVHTSVLDRAIDTAAIVLAELPLVNVVPRPSWRLNERHYGVLQGVPRAQARDRYGEDTVALWRRSYDAVPPAVERTSPDHPANDPRYSLLRPAELPGSESLADVRRRLVPYWQDVICADLHAGRVTLVVAHGNSLRALCMHLDGTSPDDIRALDIPTGVPIRYDLDAELTPLQHGGVYLPADGPVTR